MNCIDRQSRRGVLRERSTLPPVKVRSVNLELNRGLPLGRFAFNTQEFGLAAPARTVMLLSGAGSLRPPLPFGTSRGLQMGIFGLNAFGLAFLRSSLLTLAWFRLSLGFSICGRMYVSRSRRRTRFVPRTQNPGHAGFIDLRIFSIHSNGRRYARS